MKGSILSARDGRIVDDAGRNVILRGVGLGGWLLPEGYMWRLPPPVDRPRRIEAMIAALIGDGEAARFWELYRERYVAEADVERIAEEGFNSIRVPMNSRLLLGDGPGFSLNEAGFRLIDDVIGWCRARGLYAILDLHGAPGGQTGTNIDDCRADSPELFTDGGNAERAVALWRAIAERYRDEWCVAGYDLLNEPLPEMFSAHNGEVMPLYRRMARAIREVDARHMLILEGVHWATDWSIFTETIDGNMALQFHKYWNNPDTESIAPYLAARESLNVPIMMGEGGENNADWNAGAFRLFEDHGISWNFWTWKKMDTDNSPCSVRMPAAWSALASSEREGLGPREAHAILWEYLDNIPLEQCDYHPEVARSLFRRPPVRIPAAFYGYRGEGVSFGLGRRTPRVGGFRAGDGTDIRFAEGTRTVPRFQHGNGAAWKPDEWLCVQLAAGDWMQYEFEGSRAGARLGLGLQMRAVGERGVVTVAIDGGTGEALSVDGGEWRLHALSMRARSGLPEHALRIRLAEGTVQIRWIDIR